MKTYLPMKFIVFKIQENYFLLYSRGKCYEINSLIYRELEGHGNIFLEYAHLLMSEENKRKFE